MLYNYIIMKGYLCKIVVKYSKPKTWREIIIPESITFEKLHRIIQVIMGLSNYHLYYFKLDELNIICDLSGDTFDMWDFYDKSDSNTTYIDEYFEVMDKIFYKYDFGDEWEFDIEIKDIVEYNELFPTLKRHRGKYNLMEDCRAAGGWNYAVELKDHPEDMEYHMEAYDHYADYLSEFDKKETQAILKEVFDE